MPFCTKCGASVQGRFCIQCGTPVSAAAAGQPAPPPAPAPPVQPVAQPGYAPAAPVSKKTSPVVWIIVGIAGFFLLIGILVIAGGLFFVHKVKQAGLDPELMQRNPALAVAKMIATVNPDVEVLNVDERRGVIRVKDKKTGKILIADFEDAKNGNFKFREEGGESVTIKGSGSGESGNLEVTSKDGTLKFGTGAAANLPGWVPVYPGATAEGGMTGASGGGAGGMAGFKTKDPAKSVVDFYTSKLKDSGFKIASTFTAETVTTMAAEDPNGRTVGVTVDSSDSSATKFSIVYSDKKK